MVDTHNTMTTTRDAKNITSCDTLLDEVHHIDSETNDDDNDDPYDSILKRCFVIDWYPNFWNSVKKLLNERNTDVIGDQRYNFKHPNAPTNIPELTHTLRWEDVQTLCMEQPVDSKVMDYCLRMIRDELGDTCPPIFTTWDINFSNQKYMPDEYYDKDEVKILVMHNTQLNTDFDVSMKRWEYNTMSLFFSSHHERFQRKERQQRTERQPKQ